MNNVLGDELIPFPAGRRAHISSGFTHAASVGIEAAGAI